MKRRSEVEIPCSSAGRGLQEAGWRSRVPTLQAPDRDASRSRASCRPRAQDSKPKRPWKLCTPTTAWRQTPVVSCRAACRFDYCERQRRRRPNGTRNARISVVNALDGANPRSAIAGSPLGFASGAPADITPACVKTPHPAVFAGMLGPCGKPASPAQFAGPLNGAGF